MAWTFCGMFLLSISLLLYNYPLEFALFVSLLINFAQHTASVSEFVKAQGFEKELEDLKKLLLELQHHQQLEVLECEQDIKDHHGPEVQNGSLEANASNYERMQSLSIFAIYEEYIPTPAMLRTRHILPRSLELNVDNA